MSKKMMVNATHPEENRVAIVEDGILTELDIEVAGREPSKGNIYKAVVVRVEQGLQAAFVDYGAERLGFLQIDEINYATVRPDYQSEEESRRPRINELLSRGQELLVQITKEERGTKGAALTTYLSLAGRYMVLMPGSQTRGVSRKAESDSQRKALKKAMSSIDLAEGIGYIVRTAALDQTREELERDYRYLIRLYESIKDLEKKSRAPALIYKESNLMIRSIRDYFTTEMDEVLIDDPQVFKEAKDFFQQVMPDHVKLVKLHQERRPIFSRYQIEEQIETLSRNKVSLPSGGSIVIDPTEALVAIDVNSGKMSSEQGVEATATKTNLEAAAEVGRQLRLRDLGGLIVIDFIDMRERKHMRQVEDMVKKSLENDKARVSVGRISKFGLLELSRQRIKSALTEGSYLSCPHCNGTGHLKSPETQAVSLLRKIHASAAKGQVSRVEAQLPIDVASYLLNHSREELVEIERRYQLQIHIIGNRDFIADQVEIAIQKKEKDKSAPLEYVELKNLPPAPEEESKPVEVPELEELPEAEQEVADQPTTDEIGTEAGKKRRRRRRRKPASTRDNDESKASGEDLTDAEETADEAEAESGDDIEEVEGATKAKSSQRSHSGNRNKTIEAGATPGDKLAEATQAETVTGTEAQQETAAVGADVPPAKPKRRRGRRKSKSAAVTDQAVIEMTETVREQVVVEDQLSAEQAAPKIAATDNQPKSRRTSRAPKKSDTLVATTQEKTALQESSVQTEKEEKPAAKKPASGPKTRKKAAPVAKTEATTGREKPADTEASAADEKVAAKPKRSSTARTKAKPASLNSVVEETPAAEQKQGQKTTTKKAVMPKKKVSAVKEVTETAAETSNDEVKPKRTRTVKKNLEAGD